MDSYRDPAPIWDFTNAANGFTQMQDIDFMSLLDKQYSGNAHHSTNGTGVTLSGPFHGSDKTQQTNQLASSSNTPPFNDTPSPSDSTDSHYDDADGPAPKRKATGEASDGPSSKTMKSTSSSTSSRRKSTGNPAKDETRLLKRKEQNRAAQRAFRERKEKHVRDLEDKVAALEAKNEEAVHENENLRDLLSRLQTENVMLKQGHFTFSMPRDSSIPPYSADSTSFPQTLPTSSARSSFAAPPVPSRSKSPNLSNPLDWSSLTTFDPSRLNLLDDLSQHQQQQQQQQPTATDSAMQLDFGFGPSVLNSNTPFTTLASNPMFMSFASSFDSTPPADTPSASGSINHSAGLDFDMSSLTSWPVQENAASGSLEDLFQGYGMSSTPLDFSFLTSTVPISPPTQHTSPPVISGGAPPISISSSPSSSSTDPLYTPKDSPHQDFDPAGHDSRQCPKTKAELVKAIEKSGPSPFAPTCTPGVRKSKDGPLGAMISCENSSSFPKTQKNDQNVEVLSAWRSITSNPKFKDTDISELCAEFTAKARCDGTKVVLEPASVDSIIETLSKKTHQEQQDGPQVMQ